MTLRRTWPLASGLLTLLLVLSACGPAPAAQPTAAPIAAEPTAAPTLAAVAPAATAAAPTQAPTTPAAVAGQGGTLKLLWFQAPTILNPHLATGTKDFDAARVAYEGQSQHSCPVVRYPVSN